MKGFMVARQRQLGLCFECGDKYSLGRQYKRQLMNMEGSDGEKEEQEAKEEALEEEVQ